MRGGDVPAPGPEIMDALALRASPTDGALTGDPPSTAATSDSSEGTGRTCTSGSWSWRL